MWPKIVTYWTEYVSIGISSFLCLSYSLETNFITNLYIIIVMVGSNNPEVDDFDRWRIPTAILLWIRYCTFRGIACRL